MRIENLYLIGGITSQNPEYVNVVKTFLELDKGDIGRKDDLRVNLFINSQGGWSTDGLGLYSILVNSRIPITTINVGSVESMAFVVFLAGEIRVAYPHTRFHYHPTSQDVSGNTVNLQRHLESHKKIQAVISNIVATRTQLSPETLKTYNEGSQEVYWDAAEAMDFGIIHKIIEGSKRPRYGLVELPGQPSSLTINLNEIAGAGIPINLVDGC